MTFRKSHPPVGSRPGTLAIPADSPPPKIRLVCYDANGIEERDVDDVETLAGLREDRVSWVDVRGLGDEATLRRIGELFAIHPLALEDAVNVPQRAATTLYEEQQVIVARVPLEEGDDGAIEVPQVCFVLGRHYLITFEARSFGLLEPVRVRLRAGIGPIRSMGADYLAYALIDTLIDHYYPIVQWLAEGMEELEDEVIERPQDDSLAKIHRIQRQLVVIRRVGAPQREALATMLRDHSPFVSEAVRVFLRDTYDHVAQIMEAVDSTREMGISLVNLHLSNVSQRTNEVMKTLTLVASIFIPLSFVAGIYGMSLPGIPGIEMPGVFVKVAGVMAAIAIGMVWWFRRRGWL
jgi:magnesium transporter